MTLTGPDKRRRSFSRSTRFCVVVALALLVTVVVGDQPEPQSANRERSSLEKHDSFTFVRVRYDSTGGYGESWYRYEGRDWQRWETDYPQAEENLLFRLKQLTSLEVNPKPITLRLTDKELPDYPFIFMSDIGWQKLSIAEKKGLANYLARGGFLWVDDFWGDAELKSLYRNMDGLHPKWKWKPIKSSHPILSIVYELEECPKIPARIFFAQSGLTFDPPKVHRYPSGGFRGMQGVNFLGLFDDDGKLMAVATHNTDVADGWEREGESKEFFDRFSVSSYAVTINILTYAMTH